MTMQIFFIFFFANIDSQGSELDMYAIKDGEIHLLVCELEKETAIYFTFLCWKRILVSYLNLATQ